MPSFISAAFSGSFIGTSLIFSCTFCCSSIHPTVLTYQVCGGSGTSSAVVLLTLSFAIFQNPFYNNHILTPLHTVYCTEVLFY